jgi:hypothetical protein
MTQSFPPSYGFRPVFSGSKQGEKEKLIPGKRQATQYGDVEQPQEDQ